jgi:hypothetical protein
MGVRLAGDKERKQLWRAKTGVLFEGVDDIGLNRTACIPSLFPTFLRIPRPNVVQIGLVHIHI